MTVNRRARILSVVARVAGNPATVAVDEFRTEQSRAELNRNRRMIAVAALREMARPTPSWPDVSSAVGCSHTTALADWERWSALHWRDRYSWLNLIELMVREDETDQPR